MTLLSVFSYVNPNIFAVFLARPLSFLGGGGCKRRAITLQLLRLFSFLAVRLKWLGIWLLGDDSGMFCQNTFVFKASGTSTSSFFTSAIHSCSLLKVYRSASTPGCRLNSSLPSLVTSAMSQSSSLNLNQPPLPPPSLLPSLLFLSLLDPYHFQRKQY